LAGGYVVENEERSGSRADSFGTFLKTIQEGEGGEGKDRGVIALLRELTGSGPRPLKEVQESTGLEFLAFADAVNACTRSGLIEISGAAGKETIELTAMGVRLSGLVT
jgi:hypothetical protein